jgi:hypothetical protein
MTGVGPCRFFFWAQSFGWHRFKHQIFNVWSSKKNCTFGVNKKSNYKMTYQILYQIWFYSKTTNKSTEKLKLEKCTFGSVGNRWPVRKLLTNQRRGGRIDKGAATSTPAQQFWCRQLWGGQIRGPCGVYGGRDLARFCLGMDLCSPRFKRFWTIQRVVRTRRGRPKSWARGGVGGRWELDMPLKATNFCLARPTAFWGAVQGCS